MNIADTPYPKKRYRLPTILSQEEVAQLIDAAPTAFYRTILMTLYGTGVRRTELTRLKVKSLHTCAGSSSTGLEDSCELLHPSFAPSNLHESRIRRASGFLLTAFLNATPHFLSALSNHPGVASEKALGSSDRNAPECR